MPSGLSLSALLWQSSRMMVSGPYIQRCILKINRAILSYFMMLLAHPYIHIYKYGMGYVKK
jgi:hypothetical protein